MKKWAVVLETSGVKVIEELNPKETNAIVEKRMLSALKTVLGAFELGYEVIVPSYDTWRASS